MNLVDRTLDKLATSMVRWAWPVAFFGLVTACIGLYFSALLYMNLRTDLEELLPTDARSVIDLDEVTQRLQSIDNLSILIFSQNGAASRRFVDDLASELKKAPKTIIASVEYKIDEELAWFKARRALYMDTRDLERIRDFIRQKIDYEKKLYNPLNIFSGADYQEPQIDFMGMQKRYEGKASAYSRFPDGYYATPDQKKRVILVNMPGKAGGMDAIHQLKSTVETAITQLEPKRYASDLEIKYTGGVQNTLEEQAALVADLELSTVLVTIIVAIAMILYFKAFFATMALMTSLFWGTFWTFGVSYFMVGYLNANSAFLGSIVIGNGINFGIILLARYLEERRRGLPHLEATRQSIRGTASATFTAAMAAGLSYGSLSLTGFRGFNQFGLIGLVGMILCWLSAYTMLPALWTIFEKFRPLVNPSKPAPKAVAAEWFAKQIARFAWPITLATLIFTIASIAMFSRYNDKIIETDFSKLRNKASMVSGSGYLSKHVDEIFQRYLSPMALLPRDKKDTEPMAARLREIKEQEGSQTLISNVQTLQDFLPKDQRAKILVLKEIRQLLPPKVLERLSPKDQALAGEYLNPLSFKSVTERDLPDLIIQKFTEKNGALGKMVLVEPPLDSSTLDGKRLVNFVRNLRSVADSVAPGTPVAGTLLISSDMLESIARDGPKATFFAFLAVVILVVILFRNVKTIFLCLFTLFAGILWLVGTILGGGVKVNFLNFIALPITFGIGIDYGVNIFSRFKQEGPASILKVIRDTGGAVALCSFTTVVGYGSLLIAENQGFVSFGMLAVWGELTCVFAALFSLPAFLIITYRKEIL